MAWGQRLPVSPMPRLPASPLLIGAQDDMAGRCPLRFDSRFGDMPRFTFLQQSGARGFSRRDDAHAVHGELDHEHVAPGILPGAAAVLAILVADHIM